ncbi:hypothetical protein [Lacipirellula limnantheis]|uniref:Uncharacterized protein n=1 Tax=Lacipirellula limnantheis TaxID=2528024 RepID=A0A517TUC6_9BACT|nr:hypothetical protein [Lacipirellula limnantheis]QDT71979.1 hypothetical protein I41_11420 [Lacipirellula limnantheis]
MRQDWREYSGFGELLCLVLAWTVGLGAVWADYATRHHKSGSGKVAVSGERRTSSAFAE